jgi:hypothetical protein
MIDFSEDFLKKLEAKDKELEDKIKSGEVKVCDIADDDCESCSA